MKMSLNNEQVNFIGLLETITEATPAITTDCRTVDKQSENNIRNLDTTDLCRCRAATDTVIEGVKKACLLVSCQTQVQGSSRQERVAALRKIVIGKIHAKRSPLLSQFFRNGSLTKRIVRTKDKYNEIYKTIRRNKFTFHVPESLFAFRSSNINPRI